MGRPAFLVGLLILLSAGCGGTVPPPGPQSSNETEPTQTIPGDPRGDSDGDGVENADDQCPNTPVGQVPNGLGCAANQRDSDGDGFTDANETDFLPGTDPFDSTDNPNHVRDSDGDGCSDFDERTLANSCDGDPNTPQCPIELDEGQGFFVTVPCGFSVVANDQVPIPGAKDQWVFQSSDWVLLVATFQQSQSGASVPDELVSFSFTGPVVTATADFLLDVHVEAPDLQGEKAIGMLANGDFLAVTVLGQSFDSTVQGVAATIFLSIDLQGTDGSGYIDFLSEYANALLARPTSGYVVLDDDSVWYVSDSSDAFLISRWQTTDLVLVGDPDGSFSDGTLTNMDSWISVQAEFAGAGTRVHVTGINTPEFSAPEITFDNGTTVTSSYTDAYKLGTWQIGDPVEVAPSAGYSSGLQAINLRTGDAVWIP